ncbi:hypothetical protein QAD02_002524 [Eretmocerus hayati]|uniref:Uncharacterized protein n=1 Tax=Eretmocerus hayati TaxID=131215 RepID=A0ACC2NP23_9HYME|nr:hypothetical protein QAD02_002524 [Eretmocerus hayati]
MGVRKTNHAIRIYGNPHSYFLDLVFGSDSTHIIIPGPPNEAMQTSMSLDQWRLSRSFSWMRPMNPSPYVPEETDLRALVMYGNSPSPCSILHLRPWTTGRIIRILQSSRCEFRLKKPSI